MKNITIKKRAITLIEIMIVMFLIASITGVVAYNYKGSLEKSKAFKTEMAMEKLRTVIDLAAADNPDILDNIENQWEEALKRSPIVQNANTLIYDGWGKKYRVTTNGEGDLLISSEKYNAYKRQHS